MGFAQIPKWLLRCALPPMALLVYAAVVSLGNYQERVYRRGPTRLGTWLGISADQVRRYLAALCAVGALEREDRGPGEAPCYRWHAPDQVQDYHSRVSHMAHTARRPQAPAPSAPLPQPHAVVPATAQGEDGAAMPEEGGLERHRSGSYIAPALLHSLPALQRTQRAKTSSHPPRGAG